MDIKEFIGKKIMRWISVCLVVSLLCTMQTNTGVMKKSAKAEVAREDSVTYAMENCTIMHDITTIWDGYYNAEVTIANTSKEKIENWKIYMRMAEGVQIQSIWNGAQKELEVSTEQNKKLYQISNVGWNQDIEPGQSVTFGYQAACKEQEAPQECYLVGYKQKAEEESYEIMYRTTGEWKNGCIVEVAILNTTDTDMEDWKLSFDWEGVSIEKIWNAVIQNESSQETINHYEIDNDTYNSVIPAGKSVVFSILVNTDTSMMVYPDNTQLCIYGDILNENSQPQETPVPSPTPVPATGSSISTGAAVSTEPAVTTGSAIEEIEVTEEMRRWNRTMMHMDEEIVQVAVENVDKQIRVAVLDSGVDETEGIWVTDRVNFVPGEDEMNEMFEDSTGHGTAVAGLMAYDRYEQEEEEQEEDDTDYEYFEENYSGEEDYLEDEGLPDEDDEWEVEDEETEELEEDEACYTEDSYDFDNDDNDLAEEDIMGLGTFVEENQAKFDGFNPNMDLYSIRVLDQQNEAPVSRVIEGIQWAIDHDIQILNISFGTEKDSDALHKIIKKAYRKGILLVASTGNEGNIQYPAAYDEVMAVGSVDCTGKIEDICEHDQYIELTAPGEDVLSVGAFGVETQVSGTSMAAAQVSAVASILWQQDSTVSSYFIRSLLQAGANHGDGSKNGYGIVDAAYSLSIMESFKDVYEEIQMEEEVEEGSIDSERVMGEAGIDENTEEPELVENLVKANWGGKDHLNLLKEKEGYSCALNLLKIGMRLQDGAISNLNNKKMFPAWHGYYKNTKKKRVNYIAGYLYLSRLAKKICDKNKFSLKNNEGKLPTLYKGLKMEGVITEKGVNVEGKQLEQNKEHETQDNQYMKPKWENIFQCKLYDSSVGKYDFIIVDQDYKSNKIISDQHSKALIVYGMALHTMSDAFAHSAYGAKLETIKMDDSGMKTRKCVWGKLSKVDKGKLSSGKQEGYNDSIKIRPARYRAARQAVANAFKHISFQKNKNKKDKSKKDKSKKISIRISKSKVRDFCSTKFVYGDNTDKKEIINVKQYLSKTTQSCTHIRNYIQNGFGLRYYLANAKECKASEKTLGYIEGLDLRYIREMTQSYNYVTNGKGKTVAYSIVKVKSEKKSATKEAAVSADKTSEISVNEDFQVESGDYFALSNDFDNFYYKIQVSDGTKKQQYRIDSSTPTLKEECEADELLMMEEWDLSDALIQEQEIPKREIEGRVCEAGIIRAEDTPLKGVAVTLYNEDTNQKVWTRTTGEGGYYFDYKGVPVGNYRFTFEKEGYVSVEKSMYINMEQLICFPEPVRMVRESLVSGIAAGMVADSQTGKGVPGLTLNVRAGINVLDGEILSTIQTGEDGGYILSDWAAGNYCLEIVDQDAERTKQNNTYEQNYMNVVVIGGHIVGNQNGIADRDLEENQMRMVVSWQGAKQYLFAYAVKMNTTKDCYVDYEVTVAKDDDRLFATMDVCNAVPYGIQTITIYDTTKDDVYCYVADYSGSWPRWFENSYLTVEIYRKNKPKEVVSIWGESAGTPYWEVFRYYADERALNITNNFVSG